MEEYLKKIKEIADNLLLVGHPLSSEDLITQTLFGLDSEYNAIVVQLAEKASLSWAELQASLRTFESRLEQLAYFNILFQPSANIVSNKPKINSGPTQGWRGHTN